MILLSHSRNHDTLRTYICCSPNRICDLLRLTVGFLAALDTMPRYWSIGMRETITVVSGLPRSGTSMMMRMLKAGGMQPLTDNIRKPDEDNPYGYYELEAVKQLSRDTSWLVDASGKA